MPFSKMEKIGFEQLLVSFRSEQTISYGNKDINVNVD